MKSLQQVISVWPVFGQYLVIIGGLRGGVGERGPQVGEVTRLDGVTRLFI